MVFLLKLFGSAPVAPERVPTDTVIPLFERDDNQVNRSIALEFTMQFDAVLDAEKLSGALWRLLERPGWRKLGARLRRNPEGKLEYHVPAEYTKSRPPMNYTHTIEHMALREHKVGSLLPRPTGKLETFGGGGFIRVVTDAESKPLFIEDYILSDRAQLGLHITTFEDGTFVTITWLHTLLDAMGRSALLLAWQAMLEGREDDVPDFLGYDEDLMRDYGTDAYEAQEEFVLKPKQLGKVGMARFIFNYLWDLFWYPIENGCTIAMPASTYTRIKARAYADLESLPASKVTYTNPKLSRNTDASSSIPFLSDGDILTAWIMRLVVRANPLIHASPTRTVAVCNVFGMRDLLRNTAPALLPQHGAYIHNCVTTVCSLFSAHEMTTLPLGHVAARIRADLVEQGTRPQMEASQREKVTAGMPMYGDGGMAMCTLTNWYKARLYQTDFSAAIVKGGMGEGSGKPAYCHPYATAKGFSLRGSANVIGKDRKGTWWMGTVMRKDFLEEFRKAVDEEAMLA